MVDLPRPLPPPSWRDRWPTLLERARALPRGARFALAAALAVLVVTTTALAAAGALPWPGAATGAAPELVLPRADDPASAATPVAPSTTAAPERLHVHAAGAVVHPGVVELPGGARVSDAVAAAGGAAPDADLDQVNLAAPVADGDRVYVPRRGETLPPSSTAQPAAAARPSALVDLNQATATELEALPGIGPATAQAIVDYRSQHGRFRSVDELLNVRGIGPAKLEQIRPRARV